MVFCVRICHQGCYILFWHDSVPPDVIELDFRKEKKDVIELVVAGANVCVFFKLVENSFHLKNNDDTCKCHVSCFTGDIFASG